jgi:hypothetical protein
MKVEGKEDQMPLIVSADPAKISGFACYVPDSDDRSYRLARYGLLKPTTTQKVDRIFEWADDTAAKSVHVDFVLLAIEDQFLGKKNPHSLIKMVEQRMRWQVVAEMYGARVETFQPQQWQGPMLGARRGMKRKERKRASQNSAHFFFKGASFTIDEADATIIGAYVARLQVARILNSVDMFPFEGERH